MAYESFIGLRYLMAKQRSRVLSIITLLSVAGVALGVTAMIVVLSVMGGFKKDLKEKILGTKAHMVVRGTGEEPLTDPEPILETARAYDTIIGASPYIEAEAMISSPTNLNGLVLRGIDPETIGKVSDLPDEIQKGKLEYLRDATALSDQLEQESDDDLDSILDNVESQSSDASSSSGRLDEDHPLAFEDPAAPDAGTSNSGSLGPMLGSSPSSERGRRDAGSSAPIAPPITDDGSGSTSNEVMPSIVGERDDTSSKESSSSDSHSTDTPSSETEMPPIAGEPSSRGSESDEPPDLDSSSSEPNSGSMPPIAGGTSEETEGDSETSGSMPSLEGGSDSKDEPELPGLLIGKELAKSLQVGLGDEVKVVTPRGEMSPTGPIPRSRPFRVVGIFYTGMYEYDANFGYAMLSDTKDFLGQEGVTGIELKTVNVDRAIAIADRLQSQLGESVEVLDWKEMNRSLFYALKLEKIAMFVVLTFIILVASFSIIAMLIMIVLEKKRDIAVLKSMGMSDGGIMRIFILQGVVIGATGALIGLILGLAICWMLIEFGFPLNSEVYYIETLPVDIDPVEIGLVVFCTIAISFLATIYPSRKASKLQPVEGLRYE